MITQKVEQYKDACLFAKIRASIYGQGQCSEELFDLLISQNLTRSIEISQDITKTNLVIINGSLNTYERSRLEQDLEKMSLNLYLLQLGRHQVFENETYEIDKKRFKKVAICQSFLPGESEIINFMESLWNQHK
jgi:hypothetical protein